MIIRGLILAELCTEGLSIDTRNRYELARVVRKPGGVKQAAHLDEMLLAPTRSPRKKRICTSEKRDATKDDYVSKIAQPAHKLRNMRLLLAEVSSAS
jgi:hypothetical protein